METKKHKEDGTPIAFAYYKGNELIGYRMDTLGSIGMSPKIYHYSKSQVETCLKNIRHNVKSGEGFGKALSNAMGKQREFSIIANAEKQIHQKLQDAQAFEVRVVEAPEYEKEFDVEAGEYKVNYFGGYPHEAVKQWLMKPEEHRVIETHYFSMEGSIELN